MFVAELSRNWDGSNDYEKTHSWIVRERLKEEAIINAERDLAIAAEWSALEEEALERNLR